MKIRKGFVSNSSSCSFVVGINSLTRKQVRDLLEYEQHRESAEDQWRVGADYWSIDVRGGLIHGYTTMDNGDLVKYCIAQEIPYKQFIWTRM